MEKKIWAIGGGKGGVGKSYVAGNLGILLAQKGHNVVLADLDLGGANLHTWLGVSNPIKGITEFIERDIPDLKKLLIPTDMSGLRLISGAKDGVEIANMKHTQKRRFVTALRQLDADYIVIDLGAGTAYNTVDFFLLADSQIIIVIPEPTSIENAYRFLKNSFYRQILHNSEKFRMKSTIKNILRKDNPFNINTPKQLIAYMNQLGGNAAVFIEEQQQLFMPSIILNQVRSEKEKKIGVAMEKACLKYFNLNVKISGYLDFDETVRQSVIDREPLAKNSLESVPVQQLSIICEKLLKEEKEGTKKNNLLSQLAL